MYIVMMYSLCYRIVKTGQKCLKEWNDVLQFRVGMCACMRVCIKRTVGDFGSLIHWPYYTFSSIVTVEVNQQYRHHTA